MENKLLYDSCCSAGKPLQLHLQACDVKSKEEKSGPENMLTESSTGDGTTETNNNTSYHSFRIV